MVVKKSNMNVTISFNRDVKKEVWLNQTSENTKLLLQVKNLRCFLSFYLRVSVVTPCPFGVLYTAKAASRSLQSPSITSLPDDITRFLFYCGSILSKKPNSVNTNFHQNYKKPNIILKNAFHQNLEKLGITIILSKQPPNKNKRLFAKVISHSL